MKVSDVPQDLKYYKNTNIRDINYAVNENGQYQAVFSDGWDVKTDALDAAWDEVNEKCEEVLKRIKLGETSALEYYATKNLMSIDLLASYTGFSTHTVRKHFNPKTFSSLDDKTLGIYADVLRITIDEIKSIPI
jgi:hypothetical protein